MRFVLLAGSDTMHATLAPTTHVASVASAVQHSHVSGWLFNDPSWGLPRDFPYGWWVTHTGGLFITDALVGCSSRMQGYIPLVGLRCSQPPGLPLQVSTRCCLGSASLTGAALPSPARAQMQRWLVAQRTRLLYAPSVMRRALEWMRVVAGGLWCGPGPAHLDAGHSDVLRHLQTAAHSCVNIGSIG